MIAIGKKTGPEVLAHELGHATAGGLRRKTIASATSRMVYNIASVPAIALPLIILDSARDRTFSTPEELEAKAEFASSVGKITTIFAAPNLAEEALATIKGTKYLADAGAGPLRVAKGAAKLAPAFATYLAPFAAPFVASSILKSRAKKGRESAQETK